MSFKCPLRKELTITAVQQSIRPDKLRQALNLHNNQIIKGLMAWASVVLSGVPSQKTEMRQ